MTEAERCSVQGCEERASASLVGCSFCLNHFIQTCHVRLEECSNILLGEPVKGTTSKLVEQIIHECVQQASDLAQKKKDLGNAERSRLLDIMFWASELGKRLEGTPKTT